MKGLEKEQGLPYPRAICSANSTVREAGLAGSLPTGFSERALANMALEDNTP